MKFSCLLGTSIVSALSSSSFQANALPLKKTNLKSSVTPGSAVATAHDADGSRKTMPRHLTKSGFSGFCQAGGMGRQCGRHHDSQARSGLSLEGCAEYIRDKNSPYDKVFVYKPEENGWCYPITQHDGSDAAVIGPDGACLSGSWFGSSGSSYETFILHGDGVYWPSEYSCWEGDWSGGSLVQYSAATNSPTGAPTTAPWTIDFISMVASFANGTNQLVLDYQVGNGRTVNVQSFAGGCSSSFSQTNTAIITPSNVVSTESSSVVDGNGLSNLTLSHSFDTSLLTGSNIWRNTTTKIELCQVVQLTEDGGDLGTLTIAEDMRNITIDFDLDAYFTTGNINLTGATVGVEQKNTSLSDFVTAFKCNGLNTVEDESALAPNTELSVCIEIDSSAPEVDIKDIVSMNIDGISPSGASSTLAVISDKTIQITALTSAAYQDDGSKAAVTTRVPSNIFNYATGASISVSGSLILELSDGTRRRLAVDNSNRALQAADDEAGFDLNVQLQPETDAGIDLGVMMNSANDVTAKSFAIIGMIIASASALW